MQLLPAASRRTGSWVNGRGSTTEIVRRDNDQPGSTAPGQIEFDWRVSVASVSDSSPFSRFSGCSRLLMPLSGSLTLEVDGQGNFVDRYGTFHFEGEDSVRAIPSGEALDLNVIVRRCWGKADLNARKVDTPYTVRCPEESTVIVIALSEGTESTMGSLQLLDAVSLDSQEQITISNSAVIAVATLTSSAN